MSEILAGYSIYVAHYSKLAERKLRMKALLSDAGYEDVIFYEKFNQEDIAASGFSSAEALIRSKITEFIPESIIRQFLKDGLNAGEKSLALKHINIYKDFLDAPEQGNLLLILEDDARLAHNFKSIVHTLIEKGGFQCLNLSASASKAEVPSADSPAFRLIIRHEKKHPFWTGTDGYIMTRECVSRVYEKLSKEPICVPIDWELSHVFMATDLKCHKVYPPLTYQASMTGEFASSVRDRGTDYLPN